MQNMRNGRKAEKEGNQKPRTRKGAEDHAKLQEKWRKQKQQQRESMTPEGKVEAVNIRFLEQKGLYYALPDCDKSYFALLSEIVDKLPVPTIDGHGRHFFSNKDEI